MTKEELAAQLNGRQYGREITKEERHAAWESTLVVVYGASDDLVELAGAFNDEFGVYGGGEVAITRNGLLPSFDDLCDERDEEGLRDYFKAKALAQTITANWDNEGYSWTYTTGIPHATFDILEDDEKYCRGIVFSLADLGPK